MIVAVLVVSMLFTSAACGPVRDRALVTLGTALTGGGLLAYKSLGVVRRCRETRYQVDRHACMLADGCNWDQQYQRCRAARGALGLRQYYVDRSEKCSQLAADECKSNAVDACKWIERDGICKARVMNAILRTRHADKKLDQLVAVRKLVPVAEEDPGGIRGELRPAVEKEHFDDDDFVGDGGNGDDQEEDIRKDARDDDEYDDEYVDDGDDLDQQPEPKDTATTSATTASTNVDPDSTGSARRRVMVVHWGSLRPSAERLGRLKPSELTGVATMHPAWQTLLSAKSGTSTMTTMTMPTTTTRTAAAAAAAASSSQPPKSHHPGWLKLIRDAEKVHPAWLRTRAVYQVHSAGRGDRPGVRDASVDDDVGGVSVGGDVRGVSGNGDVHPSSKATTGTGARFKPYIRPPFGDHLETGWIY